MNSKKLLGKRIKFKRNMTKTKFAIRLFLLFCFIYIFISSCGFAMRKISSGYYYFQDKIALSESNMDYNGDASNINNKLLLGNGAEFIVCIDAGHGGYDEGARNASKVLEKNVTLAVSLKVGEILKNNNIKVVYTRTSDKVTWPSNEKLDLRERVKISNLAKANVFVSIHCNANAAAYIKGAETWCRFPNTEGEKLAKSIQKQLVTSNYTNYRGLKYESTHSLAVLRLNNSVSSLVEIGFLTNASDAKFITKEDGQAKCAEAIANGILKYKENLKR